VSEQRCNRSAPADGSPCGWTNVPAMPPPPHLSAPELSPTSTEGIPFDRHLVNT
jgi:hypothetical protein